MFQQLVTQLDGITVWSNDATALVWAVAVFFGMLIILKAFQQYGVKTLDSLSKKTSTTLDDEVIAILQSIRPRLYLIISLWIALQPLVTASWIEAVVRFFLIIIVAEHVIRAVAQLIDYGIQRSLRKNTDHESAAELDNRRAMMRLLRSLIIIALWVMASLFLLSNYGVNVTSLVASLGIGGIAIALALQTVLGDLFSSFSIFLDKPFVVGDFIKVGEDTGTVKKIGVKTTRLTTLLGEELVIPNSELTAHRIQNFRRMERRREVLLLGVTYETAAELLEQIPGKMQHIIDEIDGATFDRSHFASYGDSALQFETVYYIDSPDYARYMDVKQMINLEIFRVFGELGIEFAYPTQTVYVAK